MRTAELAARQTAFAIALRFPRYVPTFAELRAAFPQLSRPTAYRYLKDYAKAVRALHNPHRLSPAEQVAFAEAAA